MNWETMIEMNSEIEETETMRDNDGDDIRLLCNNELRDRGTVIEMTSEIEEMSSL